MPAELTFKFSVSIADFEKECMFVNAFNAKSCSFFLF